jgi:hypothetical protein
MNIILRDIKYLKGCVCNFGGTYNKDPKNPYDGKYNKDGTPNLKGNYDIFGNYIESDPIKDEESDTSIKLDDIKLNLGNEGGARRKWINKDLSRKLLVVNFTKRWKQNMQNIIKLMWDEEFKDKIRISTNEMRDFVGDHNDSIILKDDLRKFLRKFLKTNLLPEKGCIDKDNIEKFKNISCDAINKFIKEYKK